MNNNKDLILQKIKKIWESNPDFRLGQLLCETANYGALYYATDDELITLLETRYKIDTSDVTVVDDDKLQQLQKILNDSLNNRTPSNKGRIYIHDPKTNKMKAVFEYELDEFLKNGWILGRK